MMVPVLIHTISLFLYRLKSGDPLRKSTFYTDPYMTCRWCNLITYIDVITVRYMIAAGIDPSGMNLKDDSTLTTLSTEEQERLLHQLEGLPACRQCGRSDKFVIGPQDFRKEIEARER